MSKRAIPFRPGQAVELAVSELAGAEALAKIDGYPVFVADAVPGDRIRAEIISAKHGHARARLLEVLEASPMRLQSPCAVIKACGGCQWGQVAYEEQVRQKERQLAETLARIGGIDATVMCPAIAAPEPYRYRNKNQFPLGAFRKRVYAGFYRPRSHDLVEVPNCWQQSEALDAVLRTAVGLFNKHELTAYDEQTGLGYLRHLILRQGHYTGEILVGIVTRTRGREALPEVAKQLIEVFPEVVGVVQNIQPERTNIILGAENVTLVGRDHYVERLGNLQFRVSLPSFFQVNSVQALAMLQAIGRQAALQGHETVWDAYAGVGTIALHLSRQARKVLAMEESAPAIADARVNLQLNNVTNVALLEGKVESLLPAALARGSRPDLLVLDPPRSGCSPEILAAVATAAMPRLIYTSCHPATLARDLKVLCEFGYTVREVQPVDMFPQTHHLEAVTLLEKV